MGPAFEGEEARQEALRQRYLAEAQAHRLVQQQRASHRKRRQNLIGAVLYHVGGWLMRWGQALQRAYHDESQAEEVSWIADPAEANGH